MSNFELQLRFPLSWCHMMLAPHGFPLILSCRCCTTWGKKKPSQTITSLSSECIACMRVGWQSFPKALSLVCFSSVANYLSAWSAVSSIPAVKNPNTWLTLMAQASNWRILYRWVSTNMRPEANTVTVARQSGMEMSSCSVISTFPVMDKLFNNKSIFKWGSSAFVKDCSPLHKRRRSTFWFYKVENLFKNSNTPTHTHTQKHTLTHTRTYKVSLHGCTLLDCIFSN